MNDLQGATTTSTILDEQCKAKWNQDPSLRQEFGDDYQAYLSYEQANQAGLIKIQGK